MQTKFASSKGLRTMNCIAQNRNRFIFANCLLLLAQGQGLNLDNQGSHVRKEKEHRAQLDDTSLTDNQPLDQRWEADWETDNIIESNIEDGINPEDERIVGGTNARAGEFPFYVQGQGCGASLIWYDIALSAAHCYGVHFNSGVIIGNYRRDSLSGGALARDVVRQVRHPSYDPNNFSNDFMILKLDSEVPRGGTIQPIQINGNANTPLSNDPLTVIGFGLTSSGSPSEPWNLMKVGVNYISQNTCNTQWGGIISPTIMLCADSPGKGACFGDSGGPIFNAAKVQVGVASFVHRCDVHGTSDVYARTSGAYTWIRSQVCALSSNPPSYCNTGTGTTTTTTTTTGNVVITVQEDQYPEETAWVLKNSAGRVLARQSANSITAYNAVVKKTLSLPAGTYTFTMTDAHGDGICCTYGNGYFTIKVNGVTVASSRGGFGSYIQKQFTIGARSFSESESSWVVEPELKEKPKPCMDSVDGTFEVNQAVGEQTCDWLQANLSNFGYLCELVKVALVCPETCLICGSI